MSGWSMRFTAAAFICVASQSFLASPVAAQQVADSNERLDGVSASGARSTSERASGHVVKGATGVPTRTLVKLVEDLARVA